MLDTLLLARLGRNEEATRLTEANDRICAEFTGTTHHMWFYSCTLVLADLARERHDLDAARQLVDAAHEWAIARDAKEPLCWAALVRARLKRSRVRTAHRSPSGDLPDGARCAPYEDARRAVEDGLRIARDCGFGLYHVDLLLLRARLALEEGDAGQAIADVDTALFEGVQPPEDSGLPELLAATDPECGYAWGEAEGRQLRGEALLVQAARRLGRGDFAPARFDELPEEVRGLVDEARREFEACRDLRRKIQDPKVAETDEMLARLDGGVLTGHPWEPVVPEETTRATGAEETPALRREILPQSPLSQRGEAQRKRKAGAKKHVFLSYVRESFADVERLRDDLVRSGETIWWDRDIAPGANWKLAIRRALKDAHAFILCLSTELAGREVSGAFPEIRDAIDIHRQRAARGTFIFPVRLSDCQVPEFEIDSTTGLEDLQLVDLFPTAKRPEELRRLVEALQALPGHP